MDAKETIKNPRAHEITRIVAERHPFRGPTSAGRRVSDTEYVVTSYETPIARAFSTGTSTEFRVNVKNYSPTTTRLQNSVLRAWPEVTMVNGEHELYTRSPEVIR